MKRDFHITLSSYTNDSTGQWEACVLINGCSHSCPSPDLAKHEDIARRLFDDHRGRTRLMRWDGDTGELTEMAYKSA